MLRLENVSIGWGTRILYSKVNLASRPTERIGLVGPNGAGKTSLFSAIIGELTTESGEILCPQASEISHVAQRIVSTSSKAIDFVLSGHLPLMQAKERLAKAQESGDDMEYAHALTTYTDINEGAVTAKAMEIMHGLGFKNGDENRTVAEFSGGWRSRLALAQALLTPAQLMLLDEPTNHLDLDSVIWLENWLRGLSATIVLVSHDREFLDRVCETIWSIEDGTINRYSGNYSDFERMRAEKIRQQAAAIKAYELTAAHLKSYIERFRYKATKARQAQSRIKMLNRLQSIEPIRASYEWRFNFLEPEKVPDHLIFAENLDCGYGDVNVLHDVKVRIESRDRIGILGINGAGKSTLVKTLIGELKAQKGELRYGEGLEIGYFAQHQLDELYEDQTPLQHLARMSPDVRELELRNFLGKFRFTGEEVNRLVGPMSGGEKARLSLALLSWGKPNLLVLDEPTNHLDMQTREALTVALSSFEGAVLLVSHDRHLLRATCDVLWSVNKGTVSEFTGDLDDYAAVVLEQAKEERKSRQQNETSSTVITRKEQRRNEAMERARIAGLQKPLKKELAKLEDSLEKAHQELSELNRLLANEQFYSRSTDEIALTVKRQGELSAEIETLEAQWVDLNEKIEVIN